jgi:hypothetical protein
MRSSFAAFVRHISPKPKVESSTFLASERMKNIGTFVSGAPPAGMFHPPRRLKTMSGGAKNCLRGKDKKGSVNSIDKFSVPSGLWLHEVSRKDESKIWQYH